MVKKTNAVRELDQHKIPYKTKEYEVDESDLSAIHVALVTNTDLERIFKTLSLLNEKNELIIACIPGGDNIDLKKLAKTAGCKRVEMLPLKELTKYTGYVRGGCSPVGIRKKHESFIHESAFKFDSILISGGMRGLQIEINPKDLAGYLKMKVGDIVV